MNLGQSHVPTEILVTIVKGLSISDWKSLRHVCKDLAAITSQFLFQTIYISTQLRDRENLTSISNHTILAPSVKEIIYDSTYFYAIEPLHGRFLNKTNYTRLFWNSGNRLKETTYTKAAIERGFSRFQDCIRDQSLLAAYCEEILTNPTDMASSLTKISSLLGDPSSHSAMAVHLPDDLVRLVEALPKMTNIRRFTVSDCRHTRNGKHYAWSGPPGHYDAGFTFSIHNKGVRGSNAVVLDPRPWPESCEWVEPEIHRSWYRGFSVLMQAASMTNLKKLEYFNVECNSELSGLSHSMFDMSTSELHHAINAFRNLRTINLRIDSKPVIDHQNPIFYMAWVETLALGNIAEILSAATHLEILVLMLDEVLCDPPNPVPSFANLVGTGTWPNLRSVSLGHMVVHEKEFLEFFDRHRQTLQSLRLEQMALFPGTKTTQSAGTKIRHPWGSTFQAMAANTIALTSFDGHFHILDDESLAANDCFKQHVRGADNILQFLRAGGIKQKKKICQH